MDDPYKTLGVARDASQDAIRKAYRKLAKTHHPDLNPGNARAEAIFKSVTAANEILSDPDKRAKFDRGEIDAAGQERGWSQAGSQTYRDYAQSGAGRRYAGAGAGAQDQGWSAEDVESMFGSMFGEGARRRAEAPMRGQDERYSLQTGFLDAVNGTTTRLSLPDGRTLDVRIPPGTEDGQVLRLRGQGGAGWNGGPAGDALIEIHVAPHAVFRREGSTIRLDLPVSLREAALGGPVEIPTPGGTVRMRVPPGSDTGTELRLRGRGVPAHGGQPAGDLYATLRVMIGKPDAALEAFLREWTPETEPHPRAAMEANL